MSLDSFHPIIQRWFAERFKAPSDAQVLGWPAIMSRRDTLIAAPTGSGKTLTAFLASLDRLLRLALAGLLREQTYVVYISPLRALSNDIQRNLEEPLAEILQLARLERPDCPDLRAMVRTGDTSPKERQQMVRRPPHILVTTPESLYLLLTGKKSRENLRQVDTVILDEIHSLARDKRGSHLSLSLERLDALNVQPPMRIGLSATQKPLDELGRFLVGSASPDPIVVDIGHARELDIAIEIPQRELQTVCMHEHWAEVYERLVTLINEHRSTLIFVNTRKLAERVTYQLSERLGPDHVLSHHGSLSHRSRQQTEQRLKDGTLKAVVATASLELGIDIGHIDLVCQLGSPRSIATFLQRVGRAGHSLGLVPKGRLFGLNREELIECAALIRAVRGGRLDRVEIPQAPLDILAQQIVATVACDEWDEDGLYDLCKRAYPYRHLARADYDAIVEMLSEGISQQRGRFGAYLHRDRVNRRLKPRKGARLTAITCGGAIPEIADYKVVTDDESKTVVGTLAEDFAIECNRGDIFLLGNTSWRTQYVRAGEVVVSDAHGAPPSIPFWLGEAPGRTLELSAEVGRLREDLAALLVPSKGRLEKPLTPIPSPLSTGERGANERPLSTGTPGERGWGEGAKPVYVDPQAWLMRSCQVSAYAADQMINYVGAQQAAAGMVPTQKKLLFERFFDESGGMQLVIHAPFGTRINRAWGLAMRKRFCRSFDFELQASADDNGIVLSLGAQLSFPLEQMYKLVPTHVVRDVLQQAFLAVPYFTTRWRWNVTRALQLKRMNKGRRVPPHLQRMRSDDLLTSVFPAQTACQENITGDIPIPDHPLIRQSMDDCLHEASDIDGLLTVLADLESGAIEVVGLDSREPSPFAHPLLNANVYAFLDDAPLEERRARAVSMRRTLSVEAMRDLGRLDPEAIALVNSEAWPLVRDADELHDALLSQGALPVEESGPWRCYFEQLTRTGRATLIDGLPRAPMWVATERLPLVQAIWPSISSRPAVTVPAGVRRDWPREEAILYLVRGRIECVGPVTVEALAHDLQLHDSDVEVALIGLENQGSVLRGRFTEGATSEWCDRRLLARIHRLTLEGLRKQIAPVPPEQFMRFLMRYQHLSAETRLREQPGLLALIEQLEGFEAPAGHWEKYLLSARLESYDPKWLDGLTFYGQVAWGRLRPVGWLSATADGSKGKGRPMKALTRSTPITLMIREHLSWLLPPLADQTNGMELAGDVRLGGNAVAGYEAFLKHGALFPNQLATLLQLVSSQVEDVLGELSAAGLITSDGYPSLRKLIGISAHGLPSIPGQEGSQFKLSRFRAAQMRTRSSVAPPPGRWTLLRSALTPAVSDDERAESWARLLVKRYGVMFRDLLANESAAPSWQEIVRVYRRLEARGEIRGGRFVAGVAGEQYALAEVIPALRSSTSNPEELPTRLAATDPLNFSGRLDKSPRIPALPGNSMVIARGSIQAVGI